MTATLRTYRSLPALLAALLLLSVSAPLLCHLCGVSGEQHVPSAMMGMASHGAGSEAAAHCTHHGEAADRHSPWSAEPSPTPAECDEVECTVEADERAFAVHVDRIGTRFDGAPDRVVPADAVPGLASASPPAMSFAARHVERDDVKSHVPVRLLTSSYLL